MHQSKWDQERFRQEKAPSSFKADLFSTPVRYSIGLCFGAVILYSLWRFTEPTINNHPTKTIPIIKPLEGPMKVRPVNNLKETHQDKTIYQKLYNKEVPQKVEHLLSGPEEPIARPLNLPDEFIGAFLEEEGRAKVSNEQPMTSPSQEKAKDLNTTTIPAENEQLSEIKQADVAISGSKVKASATINETYCLQLGTLKTEEQARAEWERLSARQVLKPYFEKLTPEYKKVDLGNDMGTRVRLITGEMSKKEAKLLCHKLKQIKQDHNISLECEVKKR